MKGIEKVFKCKKCMICKQEILEESNMRNDYCCQADTLGMDSLTENQQLLVEKKICDGCFEALDEI